MAIEVKQERARIERGWSVITSHHADREIGRIMTSMTLSSPTDDLVEIPALDRTEMALLVRFLSEAHMHQTLLDNEATQ